MRNKKLILSSLLILLLLLVAQSVAAHPLGNFSINRYRHLTLEEDGAASLLYIIDMAEIPAFREVQRADLDGDEQLSEQEQRDYLALFTEEITTGLFLEIGDETAEWTAVGSDITLTTGQGDLPIIRYEMQFVSQLATFGDTTTARFEDRNFKGQVGWQELLITSGAGLHVQESTAPTTDLSNQLRDYPDNWLENPPSLSSASFSVGTAASTPATRSNSTISETAVSTPPTFGSDEFADLLSTQLDQPNAIFIALLISIGLGAAHALTPGHGKTIVGAYLVGSRGTAKHAFFLGLTTTVTHTIGVFAFGALVLFASKFFLPETFYPWLGVISGLLVVLIGFSLFRDRLKGWLHPAKDHADAEGYHTHFGMGHTHTPKGEPGLRNLFALGVSGGLIPCPSALILLLSAIALNKIGLGLLLIVAFSVGLAGVLTGIGFALVFANQMFAKIPVKVNGRLTQAIPTLSALFITIAGVIITVQAMSETALF